MAVSTEPRILFENYAVPNCGVHQFGRNLYSTFGTFGKFRFDYADVQCLRDLDLAVGSGKFLAVTVNYHPLCMNPDYLATFEKFWEHGYEARTADARQHLVAPDEVRAWVRSGHAGSGVINYFFVPAGADKL